MRTATLARQLDQAGHLRIRQPSRLAAWRWRQRARRVSRVLARDVNCLRIGSDLVLRLASPAEAAGDLDRDLVDDRSDGQATV